MTRTTTGAGLEHTIGADGIVSIRVRDGDMHLRGVDGDALRIRDRTAGDLDARFEIDLGVGSASLVDRRVSGDDFGSRGGHAPVLELDLPRGATIVVETVSADIEADGLHGDQRYQTTSGDITLRDIRGRLAIEAVSADLDIRATGTADVTARTVSGDIELRAGTLRSLQVTTTSGDVKVAGRLDGSGPFAIETVSGDAQLAPAGDVRIEMATMSGDLHSEIGGRTEGGRGHRTLVLGSAGPQVTFRSMSGDLNVVKPIPVIERGSARLDPVPSAPPAPEPPTPPTAPAPVDPPEPPRNGAITAAYDEARLRILRSLERGEIDVAEAGRRFEALDGGEPPEASQPAPDGAADATSATARVPVVDADDA
ncbi:MAG TPA: DUF4097 family beta strand repeat-containing protein [Candidatus Limnocylindrales bacterium]